MPGRDIEILGATDTAGRNGGDTRQGCLRVRRADGQRLDLAAFDVRQSGLNIAEHEVELTAEQVHQGRGAALVRHMRGFDASDGLKNLRAQMLGRARAGRAIAQATRLAARQCHQLGQIAHRQSGADDDDQGHGRNQRYRCKVTRRVVAEFFVQGRVDGQRGAGGQQQGIAIGRRARHIGGADARAGTGLVFHNHCAI